MEWCEWEIRLDHYYSRKKKNENPEKGKPKILYSPLHPRIFSFFFFFALFLFFYALIPTPWSSHSSFVFRVFVHSFASLMSREK